MLVLVLVVVKGLDGGLEILGVGVGVNLCSGEGRMAEELLDDSDVDLTHEPGGEGVAEHVGGESDVEDVVACPGAYSLDRAM